jgi:DNA-binding NtrC family response regulator
MYKNVLLAISDETFRNSLASSIFLQTGAFVESVSTGRDAKNQLTKGIFDLLMTDVSSTEVDGVELLTYSRFKFKKMYKVALFSGSATISGLIATDLLALGANIVIERSDPKIMEKILALFGK